MAWQVASQAPTRAVVAANRGRRAARRAGGCGRLATQRNVVFRKIVCPEVAPCTAQAIGGWSPGVGAHLFVAFIPTGTSSVDVDVVVDLNGDGDGDERHDLPVRRTPWQAMNGREWFVHVAVAVNVHVNVNVNGRLCRGGGTLLGDLRRLRRLRVFLDARREVEQHELERELLRRQRTVVALGRERLAAGLAGDDVEVAEENLAALVRRRGADRRVERVMEKSGTVRERLPDVRVRYPRRRRGYRRRDVVARFIESETRRARSMRRRRGATEQTQAPSGKTR